MNYRKEGGVVTPPIPRWRGFNIVDLHSTSVRWKEHFPMNDGLIAEQDFAMIQEPGFDFVRIPRPYLFFGTGRWGRQVDPDRLWLIDRVVEFGQRYGVHVMLAFHRAPGYCITSPSPFDLPEKGNLFTEDDDLRDFVTWWRTLAERYREIPAGALSFNLVNEPVNVDDDVFDRTFLPPLEAIAEITPARLVHVEGRFRWTDSQITLEAPTSGTATLPNVVNSVHLYHPMGLTHYKCPWAPVATDVQPPTWPYQAQLVPGSRRELSGDDLRLWDKEALREVLTPYLDLAAAGHAVHVGEMGSYSGVDHDVYLAYMDDVLALFAEYGIGWAMWNLRGPFGVLDNGRGGPGFEDFHGHSLDTRLLDVLRRH